MSNDYLQKGGEWMEGKVIQYARRDAVQYARQWALSRNRAYNDFTKGGGDCMNFVSQCLYAGGLPFKNNGFERNGLQRATIILCGIVLTC